MSNLWNPIQIGRMQLKHVSLDSQPGKGQRQMARLVTWLPSITPSAHRWVC